MKEINIVWFKRDLRINDNEAFYEALKDFDILPIYVIEKGLWKQKSRSLRQWHFLKECILDLSDELSSIGQPLVIRTGEVTEILEEIRKHFIIKGIFSHQETGDYYSYKRDQKIKKWTKTNNIIWTEYLQFGVFRGNINRNQWSKSWKNHIEKEIKLKPIKLNPLKIDKGEIPPDDFFEFDYDQCKGRLKGGRKEGIKRLKYFFNFEINSYSKNISSPELSFNSCSRLSPYICWGCISLREIFAEANSIKDKNTKMLKSRLIWHCHFIQKLESEPELEFREFHPFFSNIRSRNSYLLKLWSEGKTGYPFLDACMRFLNYYGWINFRMRAMLMSFASYNLWLPWQDSGLLLAQKFIDYEPGIHWCQCQMQSGTTSLNINRIYNPIKQGKDYDRNGHFIKNWVPELREIPEIFIHEPWLINNSKDYESLKETNYVKPIVELISSSKKARKYFHEISKRQGYWEISKKIYEKHGSRKSSIRKKSRNLKKEKAIFSQIELNLKDI